MVVHPRLTYTFLQELGWFSLTFSMGPTKNLLLLGCNLFCHSQQHKGSMINHDTEDNQQSMEDRLLV